MAQNERLVEQVIQNEVSFDISDYYFMIKHLLEENISENEIKYFIECFRDERKYNLHEKNIQIKHHKGGETEMKLSFITIYVSGFGSNCKILY